MIMESQVLLMIIDMFLMKKNKKLMDILMVMLSMKEVKIVLKVLLMVILMVILSMMN